ncbi:hypothetical protein BBJ28_00002072 [Nothophytophthora sp. Chile5]|nr:hypothetical protein BBJ28_00002072 [Nothophytophthora sp. Chile5]
MDQTSGDDGDEGDAFALANASLLAFLADCDMAQDVNAIPSFLPESPRSGFSLDQQLSSRQSSAKSWRQLRREEALDLRELAKELTTQLQRLKLLTRERPTTSKAAKPAKSRKRKLTWEEQAKRQALLRQSSHMENAWLKDALRCRQLQAKQLLRGFKRRLRNEVEPVWGAQIAAFVELIGHFLIILQVVKTSIDLCERLHVDRRGVTPPTDNEAVFHELMAGMDEVYAGLDNFFEKVKMRELPCPGRRNTTPRSRAEGKFVEFLDCHAVPFDVQKTERVIWKCMGEEEAQNPNATFAEVGQASHFIWDLIDH